MTRTQIGSLTQAALAAINGVQAGATTRDEAVAMITNYAADNYIDIAAITGPKTLPVALLDALHDRCGMDTQIHAGRLIGISGPAKQDGRL